MKKVNLAISLAAFILAISAISITPAALAEDRVHKVVLHVDDNDPKRMNLVLNNASNINKYYQDKGEEAMIEIVVYGPGLMMLVADKSPVKDRVKSISESYDNVEFKACSNTQKNMSKKAGKDIKLLPQAKMVDSGVIHLIQRQEEGWAYVRP
jgi:intracellular sulfur oxidation DsrE/DsrF family protein